MKYRQDIDGLRAVAVMLVLVFHFNLISGGKAGFIGVDIFFVISGYLITSIINKQLIDGSFNLKTFYVKRIRRLAPPLFVVLSITFIAGWTLLFPADFKELTKQILLSQAYIINFYFWQNINYFGLKTDGVPLLHMWSLAVEEQFYLFYPLFMVLIYKFFARHIGLALASAAVISFLLSLYFLDSKPEATFYLFPTRAWELIIGGLIPFAHSKIHRSQLTDQAIGFVGFGLIAYAVLFFNEDVNFPGYFALLPTVGTACLIFAGMTNKPITSKILSFTPAVYIGSISYSLYLIHWPVNIFAKMILEENYTLSWRAGMFALSLIVSITIYHLIENPLRKKRILASDTRLMYTYLAGLVSTVFIYLVVSLNNGLPDRFPNEVVRLAEFAEDKTQILDKCDHGNRKANASSFCHIGASAENPKWLIYGDSHAYAMYTAFDEWLKQNNESALFAFRHSCPPLFDVHLYRDHESCFNFNNRINALLENNSEIVNVFLVSTWLQAKDGLTSSSDKRPTPENSIDIFKKQLHLTIERLNDLDKNVYIWEPVPGAKESVPKAMAKAALINQPTDLMFQRKEYQTRFKFFFDALRRESEFIEAYFSPSKALCGSGFCKVSVEGTPLYYDNAHISKSTSMFWAEQLSTQL